MQKLFFSEPVLLIEMKKIQIFMNKLIYIGLSVLELNKVVMYEFWYDYMNPKSGEEAKCCYMDTKLYWKIC